MGPLAVPDAVPGGENRLAVHVGLDLAATHDYTAYTVADVLQRDRTTAAAYRGDPALRPRETFFRVQAIGRLPHGLSWAQIGAFVVALLAGLWEREREQHVRVPLGGQEQPIVPHRLYADATGLGAPLVSLLRQAIRDERRTRDVHVYALTFVHGEKYDRRRGTVGKTHLISNLQAQFATNPKRVELPRRDPMTPVLLEEIAAYRIKIDHDGLETLGGVGAHDDMVTSLALSVLDSQAGVIYGPQLYTPLRAGT